MTSQLLSTSGKTGDRRDVFHSPLVTYDVEGHRVADTAKEYVRDLSGNFVSTLDRASHAWLEIEIYGPNGRLA